MSGLEARVYRREKPIPEWKIKVVEELADLFTKHPVVAIADVSSTPTFVIQKVRKKLWRKYVMRVAKKRLIMRALKKAGIELDEGVLDELLRGQIMLVFGEGNPFKMVKEIEAEKVAIPAKPGDVAESEIRIPEGPTDLTPGPILSVFGKLRIPYQVRGGKIYIAKETVVAKPGDVISPELAGLLMTLGIRPFEKGVRVKAVLDGGVLIREEDLRVDIESLKSDFMDAARLAVGFAAEIGYLAVPEALQLILVRAEAAARRLAAETAFLTPDTAQDVIASALAEEAALIAALGPKASELGLEAPTQPQPEKAEEEAKEEEKEEAEEKEEEEGLDLGGLFGGF
ncbi:MAG: 50S ribosomal protein L10 [Desulfurococcales archaeon]|nr:50S ribosomal protein L10 [Desulfurococcales archaeon]